MEFQRTEINDFLYVKEQNWKENNKIQNTYTEDDKGKLIVDK
jgi:hypothetical protein